jgi:hypothetical protein
MTRNELLRRFPNASPATIQANEDVATVERCGKVLADPPEPKPTKWTKGEEKKLNQLVVADLRRRGIFVIVSRTDKASTNQVGLPDIVACCNGRVAMVELKASGGRLSERQCRCHAQLLDAGVPATTAYNFDDAIQFVLKHLMP